MSNFEVINILDMIESVGEDATKSILSEFSCSRNKEIERFVRQNAIEFAKKKMSVTYLVYDENVSLAAIFTLAHKALEISDVGLSETVRKKLRRFSTLDKSKDSYNVSAFLIGQFGKNDNYSGEVLNGVNLMDFTFGVLLKVQHDIGGSIVYLDCEENEKLLNFYTKEPNLFRPFGDTYSEIDNTKYIQLLKFI